MPAMRHRAGGKARARALHRHRRAGSMKRTQHGAYLAFRRGKRDALRLSMASRLVVQVIVMLARERHNAR